MEAATLAIWIFFGEHPHNLDWLNKYSYGCGSKPWCPRLIPSKRKLCTKKTVQHRASGTGPRPEMPGFGSVWSKPDEKRQVFRHLIICMWQDGWKMSETGKDLVLSRSWGVCQGGGYSNLIFGWGLTVRLKLGSPRQEHGRNEKQDAVQDIIADRNVEGHEADLLRWSSDDLQVVSKEPSNRLRSSYSAGPFFQPSPKHPKLQSLHPPATLQIRESQGDSIWNFRWSTLLRIHSPTDALPSSSFNSDVLLPVLPLVKSNMPL